ncbi:MAG TPA: efflux RND transporter periplasmic adaptor subunit [Candidatus Eisenbacteria bacterium]|nr:efflux RND transporter periplasmic adaptor subunit [Candidatus Eisenbacteria bacterium]
MKPDTGLEPIKPIPLKPPKRRKRSRRKREIAVRKGRELVVRDNVMLAPFEDLVRPRPRRAMRGLVAVLIVLGIAALLIPIFLWGSYASSYVTSNNATVKGSITQVGTQLEGVVASVEVEAGEHVKAGQVLARFEDRQLQASVLRAQSRLTEANARSVSADARIAAATSQANEAKIRHDQRVPLARNQVISQAEMQEAVTRLETTMAMERTAIADHHAAAAEVTTAQAELALARADLEAAVIRAPADGYVVRRVAEPGAAVVVGQPVIALWIGKQVWVEAWVDEDDLAGVAVGNKAKVTINSFRGREFHGRVESIGVSTDFELPDVTLPQSRTERIRTSPVVPVRIRLDQAEGLFPGLSAVVAIERTRTK